tara:strand:+ start:561 stop:1568 length:1008 start_codon:yes stop_codon:yes gene_type:complete
MSAKRGNRKVSKPNKYRVYKRFGSDIEAAMESKKLDPHLRGHKGWDAIKAVRRFQNEITSPLNNMIMSAEVHWDRCGNNAIFIQPKDVDALLKGKYSLNKLPQFFTPYPAFTLCLPASFEVNGIKPSGVLVSVHPQYDSFTTCMREMFVLIGAPVLEPAPQQQEIRNIMTVAYTVPDGAHCAMSYHGEQLAAIFSAKNFKEYLSLIDDAELIGATEAKLSVEENELQYKLIKLIVGMSVFCMAKSGSIVDGFPKVKGFTLDNPVSDGVKSHSLNTSFSTGNGTRPGEHHRTWFIRQLSHEKYYQGEFSDYIPNSRFVFVEDALVNSNVKPKHVDI